MLNVVKYFSFKKITCFFVLFGLCFVYESVFAMSAIDYLKRYDAIMGPQTFEGLMVMVAHREDDSTRTYQMRILKANDDKLRMWFQAPASAKGQEILRVGDNLWTYMPTVKKAIRLASRDSFQGGDFNNADVLRANLSVDFEVAFAEEANPTESVKLELKAKHQETSYDKIFLWLDRKSAMPVRGEYYAQSGKLLRSAVFSDVKDFHGFKRPSKVLMRNELVPKRFSELGFVDLRVNVEAPMSKFILDDLGR